MLAYNMRDMETDSIVDFVNLMSSPVTDQDRDVSIPYKLKKKMKKHPKKEIKNSIEVNCLQMEADIADAKLAISYFGAFEGELYNLYLNASNHRPLHKVYKFFHTNDSACAAKYGTKAPGIALLRPFDESPLGYEGGSSLEEFTIWARRLASPRVVIFN